MRELLAELIGALDASRPCAYCMVIATRGSTPQKPGAAMLVFPDGSQRGTLGGGCIEAEVKRRALGVLLAGAGRPEVQTFDLDDLHGWDDGLICGGQMVILAHPLLSGASPGAVDFYHRLRACAEGGQGMTEVVALREAGPVEVGDRYLFDARGNLVTSLARQPIPEAVAPHLPPLTTRRAVVRQGVAYLPTPPRITLLLVGAGHVSQAVAQLSAMADFQVEVLDDRQLYANQERFPSAARLIVGNIGSTLAEMRPSLTPATYALILTRGHNHDEEALAQLAESACGYVGMIGSRRKVRVIFDDLVSRGIAPSSLARVRAPVGLAIGAQTVPEIAVSIVAELIACRNLGPDKQPPAEQGEP